MKRDIGATEAAGFADARSYITPGERQVLFGKDWDKRKRELWERCRGQCEQMYPAPADNNSLNTRYARCKNEAHDPHHVIPRSKSRNDAIWNLLALCRTCHRKLDKRVPRFGEGRAKAENKA